MWDLSSLIEPTPPAVKGGILTTGPWRKSPETLSQPTASPLQTQYGNPRVQKDQKTPLLKHRKTSFGFFSLCLLQKGDDSPPDCSPAPDFSLKKCSQTTYPSASLDSTPGPSPSEVKDKPQDPGGGGGRGRPAIGEGGLANCSSGMLAFILPLQPVRIYRSPHETPLLPRVRLLLNHCWRGFSRRHFYYQMSDGVSVCAFVFLLHQSCQVIFPPKLKKFIFLKTKVMWVHGRRFEKYRNASQKKLKSTYYFTTLFHCHLVEQPLVPTLFFYGI